MGSSAPPAVATCALQSISANAVLTAAEGRPLGSDLLRGLIAAQHSNASGAASATRTIAGDVSNPLSRFPSMNGECRSRGGEREQDGCTSGPMLPSSSLAWLSACTSLSGRDRSTDQGRFHPISASMKNEARRQGDGTHNFEGVPLIGLLPDSPAEHAGMLPGDLIVAVNGMRTQNVSDYICAKRRCKSAMQVVFVRGRVYYEATMHWPVDARAPSPELVSGGQATKLADGGLQATAGPSSPRRLAS